MAISGASIRAAQAFVEMTINDKKLRDGLDGTLAKIRGVGAAVGKVGLGMVGAGTAILAPLTAAATQFAATGDELDKMAKRTNVAVESLSTLAFAAEQSGGSLADVETGLKGLSRFMTDIERGGTTSAETLEILGLRVEDLKDLSPEQLFNTFADAVANIQDPAIQAGVSMQVFGRAGQKLLPMLKEGSAGIAALQDQARKLGREMSTDAAKSAADMTDALNEMKSSVVAATLSVGQAMAPAITGLARDVTDTLVPLSKFIGENQTVVLLVAKVGAVLFGLGTAFVVASKGIVAFTTAMKIMQAGSLAARASLAGLAVAGILAIAYAVYQANPALAEFNRQLGISQRLSQQLNEREQRQRNNILADIAALGTEEEKRAAISKAIKENEKVIQDLAVAMRGSKKQFDELNTTFKNATGNKVLEDARRELEEYEAALESAKRFQMDLQDAMKQSERQERMMQNAGAFAAETPVIKGIEDAEAALENIDLASIGAQMESIDTEAFQQPGRAAAVAPMDSGEAMRLWREQLTELKEINRNTRNGATFQ